MNTCRFIHKKNTDYPNHITDSVLSFIPRAIQKYTRIHTHPTVYVTVITYILKDKSFPSINTDHFNH